MIRLDRVERRHGPQVLFRDLSWKIDPGARTGLVGPNGAGKSTLLRMIHGDETPDSGDVARGKDVRVGFLPQDVESFSGGSVLETALAGAEELRALGERLAEVERKLAGAAPGDPRTAEWTERYGELRHRWEALDGDRLEARGRAILGGLGVDATRLDEPVERLSGGWRMRVLLARLLLRRPQVLLLDEPTNHLDLEAIDWLESFLQDWEGAIVVVSHDRYFLNRLVREIVELDRGVLTRYAGGYDDFIEQKALREAQLEKAAKKQARERAKTERFIERFRYKASKASQVQSRVKALAREERIVTAAQARRIRFGFPPAPRSGDIAVRIEGVRKAYGDVAVYDGLDLLLRRGDRLALIGPNGAGKSTLLKMLAGRTEPDEGTLELGHKVAVHYYAQHQLEDLRPELTLLEEMARAAPHLEPQRLRTLLGAFLFSGEDADKRVGVLSGGERARLALARMLVHPANLLLLDEPTNHLDLRSREVLEDALNEYAGTLILISHDRYFINRVTDAVAVVGGGGLEVFEGDYDAWIEEKRRRAAAAEEAEREAAAAQARRSAAGGDTSPAGAADRKEERRREAEERNRRYRERKEAEARLRPLEREIEEAEARRDALEEAQTDPDVYSDPKRAAEIGRQKAEVEQALENLYARWEETARGTTDL